MKEWKDLPVKKKHTPTPWTLKLGLTSGHWICKKSGSLYERLAIVDPMPTEEDSELSGRANAAFIIRACNSHQALVDALEEILCTHDGNQPDALMMPDLAYARRTIGNIHRVARAALKLARGE
jgi:hypothetical protein